jgi:MYXO-CTERM domain-containing protein
LAGQVGCRQGDVHATLYALGAAQQAGGAAPFHDITSGNNDWKDPKHKTITGFTAGTGYDLASGWGSVDVATLIASWPPCSTADAGFPPLDASLPDTGGPIDAGLTSADSSAATHEGGAADGGATLVVDSGAVSTADGGARDAALFTTDGAAGDGGSSGGCGCTAAGAAPSRGWVAGLLLLGLVALRRRPRIAA